MSMQKFRKFNSRSAKLTRVQVAEIRRLYYDEGWSQGRLARQYNMSAVQIGRIVRGESHRDVPGGFNPNPTQAELESVPVFEIPPETALKLREELASASASAQAAPLDSLPAAVAAKAAFYTSGAKAPVENNREETHNVEDNIEQTGSQGPIPQEVPQPSPGEDTEGEAGSQPIQPQ